MEHRSKEIIRKLDQVLNHIIVFYICGVVMFVSIVVILATIYSMVFVGPDMAAGPSPIEPPNIDAYIHELIDTPPSVCGLSFVVFMDAYLSTCRVDDDHNHHDGVRVFSQVHTGHLYDWECCVRKVNADYGEYIVTARPDDSIDGNMAVIIRADDRFCVDVEVGDVLRFLGTIGNIDRDGVVLRGWPKPSLSD